MTNVVCDTHGCSQLTVAKCMHCNQHLCLKCLTRHQEPADIKLCQLNDDMNRLFALASNDDIDNNQQTNHPAVIAKQKYLTAMADIDRWEMRMSKQLNDFVSRARSTVRTSFEQISFEIEEWSTDKQVQLQQLANDIGNFDCRRDTSAISIIDSIFRTIVID
jgi:hypothetical protein